MNSSLPSFLNSPAAGPGGAPASAANALAGVLAGLEPLLAADPAQAASVGFAALMPAGPVPAAPATATSIVTVSAPTTIGAPQLPCWNRGVLTPEARPELPPGAGDPAAAPVVESFFATFVPEGSPAAAASLAGVESSASQPVTAAPASPTADMLEQAVAFAVTLLQSLLPEVTVTVPDPATGPGAGRQPSGSLPAVAAQLPVADQGQAALPPPAAPLATDPDAFKPAAFLEPEFGNPAGQGTGAPADAATSPLPGSSLESANSPLASTRSPAVDPQPSAPGPAPLVTVAADGAIEIKVELPPLPASKLSVTLPGGTPVEISAELELPGQAVVRLEATGLARSAAAATRPENFAAAIPGAEDGRDAAGNASEINFVFTGRKQVTSRSPSAGIAVAQDDGHMLAAPTEEQRTARKPQETSVLPVRAEFQAVQAPAERITAPASEPSGQSFANRAVETVTGLVEAQFNASMQKSGSVHLRMKFGGEDLSVRVAIRDGAVHTVFETDSPALRSALAREWQAVAAESPAQLMRYAEPVFSPAGGPHSPAGDASHQGSRQPPPAQSDAQQQQSQSQRPAYAEGSPFARRSLVPETFVPEPAAPRAPALLPTSLRLSVLA